MEDYFLDEKEWQEGEARAHPTLPPFSLLPILAAHSLILLRNVEKNCWAHLARAERTRSTAFAACSQANPATMERYRSALQKTINLR